MGNVVLQGKKANQKRRQHSIAPIRGGNNRGLLIVASVLAAAGLAVLLMYQNDERALFEKEFLVQGYCMADGLIVVGIMNGQDRPLSTDDFIVALLDDRDVTSELVSFSLGRGESVIMLETLCYDELSQRFTMACESGTHYVRIGTNKGVRGLGIICRR